MSVFSHEVLFFCIPDPHHSLLKSFQLSNGNSFEFLREKENDWKELS